MANTMPPGELLQLLVEQAREYAVMIMDVEGRVVWWSPGAERIFGLPAAQAMGQSSAGFFTTEDVSKGIPEYELGVSRTAGVSEDDRWHRRADGSRFWSSGALIPLYDRDGTLRGYGKILRDRTDWKEQLEELRNRVQSLTAADEQKNIFFSTLSHELRNPLAPLANAVQLLRLAAPNAANLQYPIKLIERQVDFLRRLVDDLLDVTRIGAGKVDLQRVVIEMHEVLDKAVEAVRWVVDQKRHRLEVFLPPGSIPINADPARLHQVFVNLLTNAAKYTPEGGNIWVKGTIEGNEAVVRVTDSGVGIPHEMLPRIFDLFTQVHEPASGGGLGIGLAVVKNLVSLHGGSVQVRSEGAGKGAEFTVRLPLATSTVADRP